MVNLLVVEDSLVFAEALVSMLENMEGLNVVKVFDTAERALQELDDLDIDVALVDISLPGMTGIKFVEKAHQRNVALLLLIVSCSVVTILVVPYWASLRYRRLKSSLRLFESQNRSLAGSFRRAMFTNQEMFVYRKGNFDFLVWKPVLFRLETYTFQSGNLYFSVRKLTTFSEETCDFQ